MTEVLLHTVERTVAPDGFRRDRAVSAAGMAERSEAKHDFDTLFYQVVRQGSDLHLIAPKLLNFAALLKRTRFSVDGQAVGRPQIRNYYRHSMLVLRNAPEGRYLDLTFPDGQTAKARISDTRTEFLRGLDCELILSKNDGLDWISERLRFHVETQGLSGLVFIDNGSDHYSLGDLQSRLEQVGLKRVVLMAMPYRYGPMNRKPRSIELYLQTSAYNIARLLFLREASGVLCMDNDEILIPGSLSMFEHARRARMGFVAFHGENRFPAPGSQPPFNFNEHYWTPEKTHIAPTKWCLVPSGPYGSRQWRPHNPEGNFLRPFQTLKGNHYYHCLGMTTGWKGHGRHLHDALREDQKSWDFWNHVYGPALASQP